MTDPLFLCAFDHRCVQPLRQHFGSRIAIVATVHIQETAVDTCRIESLEGGWFFLLPRQQYRIAHCSGRAPRRSCCKPSRLIAPQIEIASVLDYAAGQFRAYPRILDPLCASGWLACGNSALGCRSDLRRRRRKCSRQGILASAVIEALMEGCDSELVRAHYSSRLLSGFLRHLETCSRFYASANTSSWWQRELADLRQGTGRTRNKLSYPPKPGFRLKGFRLEPAR